MVTKLKPYNPSADELVSDWHVIDAKGKVLGRLATEVAMHLMGKHRPGYVPHMLSGDFVVVTNAADIVLTGNKAEQIVYTRHEFNRSGHIKQVPLLKVQEKFPERIVEHAVRGMLPRNRLGERMIRRLKVYAGEAHPHAAQVIGAERRPEREAAQAEKAAEAARKAAERKERAAAKVDIAAEAKGKAAAEKKPATRRRSAAASTKAEASTSTRKPRAAASKTSGSKAAASSAKTPRKSASSEKAATEKATTRRSSSRSKKSEE
jgi:large subunit ribosomal protein L13